MKFFVIYRDNDLFRSCVHEILSGLDIVGTFVVPQGVEMDAVSESATVAVGQAVAAGATRVITDDTCYRFTLVKPDDIRSKGVFGKLIVLDDLFKAEIAKVCPNNTVAENFAWFARQVVNGRSVVKVVIVKHKSDDHRLVGCDQSEDHQSNRGEERRSAWMAEQMAVIFTGASITVVDTLEEALMFSDNPATLVVLDRHCGVKDVMAKEHGWYDSLRNWPYQAMLYMLPFETTTNHLCSSGVMEFAFDTKAMRSKILKAAT